MLKRFLLLIICSILFAFIGASYATHDPLVNIGQNSSANATTTEAAEATGVLIAAGIMLLALHHNTPSQSAQLVTIFLSADNDQLYRINQNAPDTTEWIQIGTRPAGVDSISSFALSPDGNTVFIEGRKPDNTEQMYRVAANAGSGVNWEQVGTPPIGVQEWIGSFALSPDGSMIFIEGKETDDTEQVYRVATNAGSGVNWEQVGAAPTGVNRISSFDLSSDGSMLFIDGRKPAGTEQMYRVAANAGSGSEWDQVGTPPSGVQEWIGSFALSPDGSMIFIEGRKPGSLEYMYKVAATAGSGVNWEQVGTHPAGVLERIYSFSLSPDGNIIFIEGVREDVTGQMYRMAANAGSGYVWEKTGLHPTEINYISSFASSPDGGTIFIEGRKVGVGTEQMYKVAANAGSGNEWEQIGTRPAGVNSIQSFVLSLDTR